MTVVDLELNMTAQICFLIRNFIFFPTAKLLIAFRRSFRQTQACRMRIASRHVYGLRCTRGIYFKLETNLIVFYYTTALLPPPGIERWAHRSVKRIT